MELKYRQDLHTLLCPDPIVAELGCAEGLFSADMAKWVGKFYMVDAWATLGNQTGDGANDTAWHEINYKNAMDRVAFAKEKITVLRGITWEMAAQVPDGSLDMVYLDACHMEECVRKDLEAWLPKVKPMGIVAGHDFLNSSYGVGVGVRKFCKGKYELYTIEENKQEDAGFYFVNRTGRIEKCKC